MSAPYSSQDMSFDREQMHGPMCPIHNVSTCACCEECGKKGGHYTWCRDREYSPEDENVRDEPIREPLTDITGCDH